MRSQPFKLLLTLTLGVLATAIAIALLPASFTAISPLRTFAKSLFGSATLSRPIQQTTIRTMATAATATASDAAAGSSKGSVYFLSHGGPPTMFETESKPYKAWIKYGKEVTAAKPRGLVVVSAHWENDKNSPDVIINEDSTNPLVYDFYGFPKAFYQQKFASRGDAKMLSSIKTALKDSDVKFTTERRGLDHGIWVPFLVAFNGSTDIPIIQVSLPGDSSPLSAAKLGKALSSLRDEGYSVMATGQIVHNLRDLMTGRPMPYSKPFLGAAQEAVHSKDPLAGSINLFRHPLYRQAHPSPEHLTPFIVSTAAVDPASDKVKDIFVEDVGGLGWGMWVWKPQADPVEASA